jgi:hypothetical protein
VNNAILRPMPKSDQPPSIIQLKVMRDSDMPDVPTDSDVLSLFNGDLSEIRQDVQALFGHLLRHQNIDRQLWDDVKSFAVRTTEELESLLCKRCLHGGNVMVGRGRGFDDTMCDPHIDELLERSR